MKKVFGTAAAAAAMLGLLLQQAWPGGRGLGQVQPANGINTLVRVPSPKEPVEIGRARVGDREVNFGVPFAGDDDWAGAFSCEVRNTSGKVITELRMSLTFEAGAVNPRRVQIPITHSEPVQPNGTVRVAAASSDVASLRSLTAGRGIPLVTRKAELRLQTAKFQDDSVWVKGVLLGPPDPRTGRRKRV